MMQYNILPKMREHAALEKTGLVLDGAPPHHTRKNMAYLDKQFGGRIIGRDQLKWNGRGREWAPHSCDMHVCDYYIVFQWSIEGIVDERWFTYDHS